MKRTYEIDYATNVNHTEGTATVNWKAVPDDDSDVVEGSFSIDSISDNDILDALDDHLPNAIRAGRGGQA